MQPNILVNVSKLHDKSLSFHYTVVRIPPFSAFFILFDQIFSKCIQSLKEMWLSYPKAADSANISFLRVVKMNFSTSAEHM